MDNGDNWHAEALGSGERFEVRLNETLIGEVGWTQLGEHNMSNALAAIAAARHAADAYVDGPGVWRCPVETYERKQMMAPRFDASGRFHGPGSIEVVNPARCDNTVVPLRCVMCGECTPSDACAAHMNGPELDAVLRADGWGDGFCQKCRAAAEPEAQGDADVTDVSLFGT